MLLWNFQSPPHRIRFLPAAALHRIWCSRPPIISPSEYQYNTTFITINKYKVEPGDAGTLSWSITYSRKFKPYQLRGSVSVHVQNNIVSLISFIFFLFSMYYYKNSIELRTFYLKRVNISKIPISFTKWEIYTKRKK